MSDKKGINPAAAGIAGAVIGAAAAAAAIVLSNEKNRKKAEKILSDLEENSAGIVKEITKKALELKGVAQKGIEEGIKAAKAQTAKEKTKK
jgi:VIT1/CCC1 family predicted Fe2+/Mn2+ transporter